MDQALLGGIVGGKYRIEAHIGQTRYADKFEAVDIREVAQIKAQGGSINRTATKYLVKMAKKNEKEHGGMDKSMMLKAEGNMMIELLKAPSVPRLFWAGETPLCHVLVIEGAGPTLDSLFRYCRHQFSLKTLCQLAVQGVSALHSIHKAGIIHRNLSVENLAMGNSLHAGQLFILDYGQATTRPDDAVLKLRHDSGAAKYNVRGAGHFVGDLRFASIDAHDYMEQSEKNDLESLAYILLYLALGYLPWAATKDIEDVGDQKEALNPEYMRAKLFPRQPPKKRYSGEAAATWMDEMVQVMVCISQHISIARDHDPGGTLYETENALPMEIDYDAIAGLYRALLEKHELVLSGHYDWHDRDSVEIQEDGTVESKFSKGEDRSITTILSKGVNAMENALEDGIEKLDVYHREVRHQRAMQDLARRCVRALGHTAGSSEAAILELKGNLMESQPTHQADVLYHMSEKHREEWLQLLEDTPDYEVVKVLCQRKAGDAHVDAIRRVSKQGFIPIRVNLADKTFVTVPIKVSSTVQEVKGAVARKCDLRHFDTYGLYVRPPPRFKERPSMPKERQMEHLPDQDTFVSAFADVDRRFMDDTDKQAGAKAEVHFSKRLTFPQLAEEQRFTPSYSYMAYIEARRQVMTGEFGVPGRISIGHLASEVSVPFKVMLTHGDCLRLAVLMLLHEHNGEVLENIDFSSTPERREQLKHYIPPEYIADLKAADELENSSFFGLRNKLRKGAVEHLADELKREYRSFGYANKNLTKKMIEDAFLTRCKLYAHFGARFFWMKEIMNRDGFETNMKSFNVSSQETCNAWIGVGPAGLITCQGKTRELFGYFPMEDVLNYKAGITGRGNLVLQVEVIVRLEGQGHHVREPEAAKASFKTQGAFQIVDLLNSYKHRPPTVVKSKEFDSSLRVSGATRAIYQNIRDQDSSSSSDEDSSHDSEEEDVEAELAELKLAHASAAESRTAFDYDTRILHSKEESSDSKSSSDDSSSSDSSSDSDYSDSRSVVSSVRASPPKNHRHYKARKEAVDKTEKEYLAKVKHLEKKTEAIKLKKQDVLKREEAKWTKRAIGKVEDGFDKGMMLEVNDDAAARGEHACALGSKLVTEFDRWALKNEFDSDSDEGNHDSDNSDTTDYASTYASSVSRVSKRKPKVGYTPTKDAFPKTRLTFKEVGGGGAR